MPVMSTTLKPVISLISDEIFSRLQTLVSGSVGAYSFTKVVRPTKLATYTPQNGLIVLTRGEIVRLNDLDCPGNPPSVAYMQTFLIRVHIAPSEKDTTPIELYEDVAEAEIHRAIRSDDTWHTFNENAINADFGPQQTATSDGGYDGIAIPLMVTYRVAEGDPYTVRA
jgi:hypothetical protein